MGGAKDGVRATTKADKKKGIPKLEDFIQKRDYMGAITLIEVWHILSVYS